MQISVIIAVYNTEQYLPECLDSLLRQSHQDWDAWCVDDGSTDGSLAILKQYAEKDRRIHVVEMHKNKGQAIARNTAINLCEGDLVAFLDSDDWLGDDGLEEVNRVFTEHPKTDCVLWDCQYVYPDHSQSYKMPHFDMMTGKEAFEKSLNWQIHGVYVTTAKIHKKYLYDTTSKWYSDDNTTRLHYLASREVRTCNGVYYYRQHESSVTHKVNMHHFDILAANRSMRQQLHEVGAEENALTKYEEVKWRNIVGCYLYYFVNKTHFTKNEHKTILSLIKEAFKETEFNRIPITLRWKFGYSPMCRNWFLFHIQEELYFHMRGLLGKNVITN